MVPRTAADGAWAVTRPSNLMGRFKVAQASIVPEVWFSHDRQSLQTTHRQFSPGQIASCRAVMRFVQAGQRFGVADRLARAISGDPDALPGRE
jgi:hypothetical protein